MGHRGSVEATSNTAKGRLSPYGVTIHSFRQCEVVAQRPEQLPSPCRDGIARTKRWVAS